MISEIIRQKSTRRLGILFFGCMIISTIFLSVSEIGQSISIPSPYIDYSPYSITIQPGEKLDYNGTYNAEMVQFLFYPDSTNTTAGKNIIQSNISDTYTVINSNNYTGFIHYNKYSTTNTSRLGYNGETVKTNISTTDESNDTLSITLDNQYNTYLQDLFIFPANIGMQAFTNNSYIFNYLTSDPIQSIIMDSNKQNNENRYFEGFLNVTEIISNYIIRVNITNASTENIQEWKYNKLVFEANENHSRSAYRIRDIVEITDEIFEITTDTYMSFYDFAAGNISQGEFAYVEFGYELYDTINVVGRGYTDDVLLCKTGLSGNSNRWINNILRIWGNESFEDFRIVNVTNSMDLYYVTLDREFSYINFVSEGWIIEKYGSFKPIYTGTIAAQVGGGIRIVAPSNITKEMCLNRFIEYHNDSIEQYHRYAIKSINEYVEYTITFWDIIFYPEDNSFTTYLEVGSNFSIGYQDNFDFSDTFDYSGGMDLYMANQMFRKNMTVEQLFPFSNFTGTSDQKKYAFNKTCQYDGTVFMDQNLWGYGKYTHDSIINITLTENNTLASYYIHSYIILNATLPSLNNTRIVYCINVTLEKNLIGYTPPPPRILDPNAPLLIASYMDFLIYSNVGNGSIINPFIIKDRVFPQTGTAIQIMNTGFYFEITNISANTISLINVMNGKISNNQISAINGQDSSNIEVLSNHIGTIQLYQTSNITIAHNRIKSNNTIDSSIKIDAYSLDKLTHRIYNNTIEYSNYGMWIQNIPVQIENNTVLSTKKIGIVIYNSPSSTVKANSIQNTPIGIQLQYTNFLTIEKNQLRNNVSIQDSMGISLIYSEINIIQENCIQGFENGLKLAALSSFNNILRNNISFNFAAGLLCESGSNNNTIMRNNFTNNSLAFVEKKCSGNDFVLNSITPEEKPDTTTTSTSDTQSDSQSTTTDTESPINPLNTRIVATSIIGSQVFLLGAGIFFGITRNHRIEKIPKGVSAK